MTPEQLKASILQRAMEGKLVPQNPNDEPASELLKRIKAEKEKLISEGKIKRDKKETEIFRGDDGKHYEKFDDGSVQEIDVPYDIPDTWEWVRLRRVISLLSGRDLNKSNYFDGKVGGTPYITGASNFSNGLVNTNRYTNHSTVLSYKGDLLITVKGTIGELAFNYFQKAHIARQIMAIQSTRLNLVFLKYQLQQLLPNIKLQAQSMIPGISRETLLNLLIPLPPLSEQKRIVKAIEEALAKVDEYAENYNKLQKLDKEFPDKLKKSILQYAIQGKLVEQDPNDEPVEVLLEKIRAEKQKLFEEGKIKKKDLDISIVSQGDDNSYYGNKDETTSYPIYEIPEAWRYIKFASLVNFRIGKTPPRSEATFWGTEIPWVSISDMPISGYVTTTRESISKLALKSKKIDISPKGTLLMSFKLSIGKVAILDIPATHNEAIISIFPYANKENIIRDYLMIFLPLISTLGDSKDAIKGKTLNSTSISELLIPISNHEEMKRIISKVDLLFQKVSQLSE